MAVLLSFALAIGICEFGLRVGGPQFTNFYQPEPTLGSTLIPGSQGWFTKEGRAFVQINRWGMRDVEHTQAKPPNTVRIAVLGDSYAEAMQVPIEKTFWFVLEQELARCAHFAGTKMEVLNFGCSGYGTTQELLQLQNRVWQFSPDIVLLALLTGNDVRNNSKRLEPETMRPFYVFDGDRLMLDDSFTKRTAFQKRNSRLYRLYSRVRNKSQLLLALSELKYGFHNRRLQANQNAQAAAAGFAEAGLDDLIYIEPKDSNWVEAWRITEEVLLLMRDEVARRNARFVVVTLSNALQAHPDRQVRQKAIGHLMVDDLFYPERRLKRWLETAGVPVLNLAPGFQQYAEQHEVYLHGFKKNNGLGWGHWNGIGHQLAGELISRWLCEISQHP